MNEMTTKQAAQIIKKHTTARDAKASLAGLNSVAYNLRHVGDAVGTDLEDVADDILAGRGPGSASSARRVIRIAKKIS